MDITLHISEDVITALAMTYMVVIAVKLAYKLHSNKGSK